MDFSKTNYITEKFLIKIRHTGKLSRAIERISQSSIIPKHNLSGLPPFFREASLWALICEEILDTEHDPEHYELVVTALILRGLGIEEIHDMRVFAWKSAGWLNYECMMWDWVSLDEKDIFKALEMQEKEGIITTEERKEGEKYTRLYLGS